MKKKKKKTPRKFNKQQSEHWLVTNNKDPKKTNFFFAFVLVSSLRQKITRVHEMANQNIIIMDLNNFHLE